MPRINQVVLSGAGVIGPETDFRRDELWQKFVSLLPDNRRDDPLIGFANTVDDSIGYRDFHAASSRSGYTGLSITPLGHRTDRGTTHQNIPWGVTDIRDVDIFVLSGPHSDYMTADRLPEPTQQALRRAALVVADDTAAAYLFERYRGRHPPVAGDPSTTEFAGIGRIAGLGGWDIADFGYDYQAWRQGLIPSSHGMRHFSDGFVSPNDDFRVVSREARPADASPPRGDPYPHKMSVAIGGLPDGGMKSVTGQAILKYLCALASKTKAKAAGRAERPRVVYVGAAMGDAAVWERDLAEGANHAGITADLRFARVYAEAGPFPLEPHLHKLIASADVVIIGGGITSAREALFERYNLYGALRQAWENGALLAGRSDGMFVLSAAGLSNDPGHPYPIGLAFTPEIVLGHAHEPARVKAGLAVMEQRRIPRVLALPRSSMTVFTDGQLVDSLVPVGGRTEPIDRSRRPFHLSSDGAKDPLPAADLTMANANSRAGERANDPVGVRTESDLPQEPSLRLYAAALGVGEPT